MITKVHDELKTPADLQWGYRFGCEGLLSLKDAMTALGNVSKPTIYRRIEEGLIRKGRDKGRAVICKKSLDDYKASLES